MNWFYAQDGRQAGPVEDGELDRLMQTGAINGSTLVWHSGMTNWEPYTQARGVAPVLTAAAVSPVGGSAYAVGTATVGPGQVRCSECARVFPEDEVVQVEGLNVCADCKPIVLQKLREGVRPAGAGFDYAGFWLRFGAWLIDFVLIFVVAVVFGGIAGGVTGAIAPDLFRGPDTSVYFVRILQGVVWLLVACYEIFMITWSGATVGPLICGLRIVRSDGSRLTFLRSLARYFARKLNLFTMGIGYVMIAFDGDKRGLHDQICDTRVVRKN